MEQKYGLNDRKKKKSGRLENVNIEKNEKVK